MQIGPNIKFAMAMPSEKIPAEDSRGRRLRGDLWV